MTTRGVGATAIGLALSLMILPCAWADEAALALPPPDETAAIVVEAAPPQGPAGTLAAAPPDADPFTLPEPPAAIVAIEATPADLVATGADPVRTGSIEPSLPEVAAPVVISAGDALIGALEVRLADPKLPLPPKLSRRDRDGLVAAYTARHFRPLWIAEGAWTTAGRAVADRLARAAEDGLDPVDYPVPSLSPGTAPLAPVDLAEADAKLSAAAILYARDARGARLDPARISGLITAKLSLPAAEAVVADLGSAADSGAKLQGYNPAYPGYAALRAKLAEIRAGRVATPLVRAPDRAGLTRQAAAADGVAIGTRASAMPRLEGDLVANMERWRWLPAESARRYVAVNVPEFRLRVFEGDRVVHQTRVITGKPVTPTPIFSGLMEYAIVNPSWFIPPSILKKEILPGLAADPTYASRRGYDVVRHGSSVSVRQPPGPGNALGYIKFMFPNDHAVYLHDTPSRGLFGSAQRAFSHGCVRVENPFALGGAILGANWTEARLKSLIGHGERTIVLAEKIPVHLTYFTLAVDEFGEVRTFDDIYGYNRRVRAALGLGA